MLLTSQEEPLFVDGGKKVMSPIAKISPVCENEWVFYTTMEEKAIMLTFLETKLCQYLKNWSQGDIDIIPITVNLLLNHDNNGWGESKLSAIEEEGQQDDAPPSNGSPSNDSMGLNLSDTKCKATMPLSQAEGNAASHSELRGVFADDTNIMSPPDNNVAKQIEFPQGYPPSNEYKFNFDYHEVQTGEIQVPIKGRVYTEEQVNQILKGVKQQCEETITKTIIATLKILNIESELQKQLKERDERIMQVITSIDLTVKDLESNAISAITSSSGTKSDLPSSNERIEQAAKDRSTNTKPKKPGSYVVSFNPPDSVERPGASSNSLETPNSYNGPLKSAVESATRKLNSALAEMEDEAQKTVHTSVETPPKTYAGALQTPLDDKNSSAEGAVVLQQLNSKKSSMNSGNPGTPVPLAKKDGDPPLAGTPSIINKVKDRQRKNTETYVPGSTMTTSSVTSPKPKMDLEHDLEVEKRLAPHGGKKQK
jgi:hypothetical protein